jgi:hypothetical protein
MEYVLLGSTFRIYICNYNNLKVLSAWALLLYSMLIVFRSHWPRGLRNDLYSHARILVVGSNPTGGVDVCMCLFRFMLSCVYVAALRRTDPQSKESYGLRRRRGLTTEKAAKVQQRAVTP